MQRCKKDYDIDIRTNGGCIIVPPSKYFDDDLKSEVSYTWEKSIFDHEPSEVPQWIKEYLLKTSEQSSDADTKKTAKKPANTDKGNELVEFQKVDLFEDPKLNELVFNSLNGRAGHFAEIIYYYHENNFIYAEDGNWYMYRDHRWMRMDGKNTDLRHDIQPKLENLYSTLYKYYKENDSDKQKLKSLKSSIPLFADTLFKNNVITELIDIYAVRKNPKRNFILKLDADTNLIGFDNGIYDLDKFEFRKGKPNDYIAMTVGYDYNDAHTEKYCDLLKFLEDIQPNKDEREYMLTYLSIGLVGNQLELFTILTGLGRNGKSKLIELLKFTFGNYYGNVSSQLFTRPRPDANAPDPGLVSLIKKRVVIASEPEKNSKLNTGFIKFITGRDATSLRNCHSNNMIDFTARFITLLICNDIPDCDDMDNAFSKRLRCINFPNEFVDDPTKSNQKKIDVNINKNFNCWKLDFMLLLIEYYKKYARTHELKPSNNILKWTNKYKDDGDIYLRFLKENIEETDKKEDRVHCVVLYESFKRWFKLNNPSDKIPSDREFVKNLRKHKNVEEDVRIGDKVRRGVKKIKFIER